MEDEGYMARVPGIVQFLQAPDGVGPQFYDPPVEDRRSPAVAGLEGIDTAAG
jgi:hypothetical protein